MAIYIIVCLMLKKFVMCTMYISKFLFNKRKLNFSSMFHIFFTKLKKDWGFFFSFYSYNFSFGKR